MDNGGVGTTELVAKQERDAEIAQTEQDVIDGLRRNAKRAVEIEATLLEKCAAANPREIPQALRAVADVKAKSVDKLMALTGRTPVEGKTDMAEVLAGLAQRGLVRVNVDMQVAPGAELPRA